jgi:hypothetical protein
MARKKTHPNYFFPLFLIPVFPIDKGPDLAAPSLAALSAMASAFCCEVVINQNNQKILSMGLRE